MEINKLTLNTIPQRLTELSDAPSQLFVAGANLESLLDQPAVAIVGSRKVSTYGRDVAYKLAHSLAAQGIVIVSGLALGVDGIAHRAALEAGGKTIAVLPGPIEHIYPRSHVQLAAQIIKQSGALVSEYPVGTSIMKHQFIGRNRLVAGLSDGVLITEAALKSGSLHTARFALEQGRDVMAVPGNITSVTSVGCNNLLKAGAYPITEAKDVLHILGVEESSNQQQMFGSNEHEQILLDLLNSGVSDGDELQLKSQLDIALFSQTLTMLEISGKVRSLGANTWTLH